MSSLAFAVTENELSSRTSEIEQNYRSAFQAHDFTGTDGVRIHTISSISLGGASNAQKEKRCAIVFSEGVGDFLQSYAEFFYDLRDLGCDIYAIDHRGQGDSGRFISDSQKSHVINFSDYVDDFTQFVKEVVQPARYSKVTLIAESMGGGIASGYLRLHPKTFSQVILLAPMMKIDLSGFPDPLVQLTAQLAVKSGFAESYAPGQKPFDPKEQFQDNTLTSSATRFQIYNDTLLAHPEWQMGGVTYRWLSEILKFTDELRKTQNLFQVPTVIFQAEHDEWVLPEGQTEVCEASPGFCSIVRAPGSKHEILLERDQIRSPVMTSIRAFITALH